ncbi:MAG: ABC transporter ATP-binding protein, partial [Anaerolineales bacterium]|nr:ABC transporter ATP-binding protein [Anaerolineales bacterium]
MHGHLARLAQLPDERPQDRSGVVLRLVSYLRPYLLSVTGAVFFIILSAFSQAAAPYLIGMAVDGFIQQGDAPGLARTMIALGAVYLLGMIAMRFQIQLISYAGQHVLADLRKEVINRIHSLSLKHLEGKESGDLMSRLVNDIEAINSFFGQSLSQSLGAIFSLIGIVVAMFLLNWQLALAALLVVPIMIMATGQFSRIARKAFRKTRITIGDVSADIQEDLSSVKVAQAYNRSDINIQRFSLRNAANRDANVSANAVTSAFAPTMDVLSTIDTAIIAGYGGFLAIQGVITPGIVVAFLQYVQNFFRPIQTVSQTWTLAQSAFAAAERIFDLIDIQPDIVDQPDPAKLRPINGQVEFKNVSFSYNSTEMVLKEIDFSVEPGTTVAVVGPTGAGKSTLVSLILRLYDVTDGQILIDGYDVRNLAQKEFRSQMALVSQDPFLFSGSVLENIRYGSLEASDEEVMAAAIAANAHEFIENLPEGYNTQVGERGGLLSLGQKQLISIARAVLASPRILILDEATASIDTRTEVLIKRALDKLLEGRTSFVIAHRLSTVRNADLVLVLDQGKIIERGKHEVLISQGG